MYKRRKRSIPGPIADWMIPLKHNFWFQLGVLLTITGLLQIAIGILVSRILLLIGILLFFIGLPILGATEGGRGTVFSYRRTKAHIKKYEKLQRRFEKQYSRKMYCSRVGVWAAAREFSCTQQLSKRLVAPCPLKIW